MPDEDADGKKALPARSTDKLGLKVRGRDLGGTVEAKAAAGVGAPAPAPAAAQAPAARVGSPAFKAAYFNKDVIATNNVNLRAKPMQALRGGEGATDLKKVVLPPPVGAQTPDPARLRAAIDLMGAVTGFDADLASLVARQGAWTKGPGVTAAMIQARMAQLEHMVQDRIAALRRMAESSSNCLGRSVTTSRAAEAQGTTIQVENLAEDGAALVRTTTVQAQGLHHWIAKALKVT